MDDVELALLGSKEAAKRLTDAGYFKAAEWARILGVKKSLISNRLARGWSVEDTLTKEVQYNARWAK